jgi:hypothetical protein
MNSPFHVPVQRGTGLHYAFGPAAAVMKKAHNQLFPPGRAVPRKGFRPPAQK